MPVAAVLQVMVSRQGLLAPGRDHVCSARNASALHVMFNLGDARGKANLFRQQVQLAVSHSRLFLHNHLLLVPSLASAYPLLPAYSPTTQPSHRHVHQYHPERLSHWHAHPASAQPFASGARCRSSGAARQRHQRAVQPGTGHGCKGTPREEVREDTVSLMLRMWSLYEPQLMFVFKFEPATLPMSRLRTT